MEVLDRIRQAQRDPRDGYQLALSEIQEGEKVSHWIWYIWPCLAPVRETSRPEFSLPDLEAARLYMRDPELAANLREITWAAATHLEAGVRPGVLMGSLIDATKLRETLTLFLVLAVAEGNWEVAAPCCKVLQLTTKALEENTLKYITREGQLPGYLHDLPARDALAKLADMIPSAAAASRPACEDAGGTCVADDVNSAAEVENDSPMDVEGSCLVDVDRSVRLELDARKDAALAPLRAPPNLKSEGPRELAVLERIKKAQRQKSHGYAQALKEIRKGEKQSCWIWYIWPCLDGVRRTSRPEYSLPDLDAARAYLRDSQLASNLQEITSAAVLQLRKTVPPFKLMGGATDAQKLHETLTLFVLVAAEAKDPASGRPCLDGLRAARWTLEEQTWKYVVEREPAFLGGRLQRLGASERLDELDAALLER